MKRLAVWLSVMVCFFGSYQLSAAPFRGGAVGQGIAYAIRHKWPWWVILLIVVAGIVVYIDDKEKDK